LLLTEPQSGGAAVAASSMVGLGNQPATVEEDSATDSDALAVAWESWGVL
jgi:hypothetical protein